MTKIVLITNSSHICAFYWYRDRWPWNDLEWRNGRYFALLHLICYYKFYYTVWNKNVVQKLSFWLYMTTFMEITENECVKERHPCQTR